MGGTEVLKVEQVWRQLSGLARRFPWELTDCASLTPTLLNWTHPREVPRLGKTLEGLRAIDLARCDYGPQTAENRWMFFVEYLC